MIHNGVGLDSIGALVEGVKADARMGKVTFKANSHWDGGARAVVTVESIDTEAGPAVEPGRRMEMRVDEPLALGGSDRAPNPVEHLAAGLCGCLTAGIATNAALFETDLERIEVSVEMDYDIIGLLAIDKSAPTGATALRYNVRLKGAPGVSRERLERAKQVIDGKSPVLNTLINGVKAETSVEVIEG